MDAQALCCHSFGTYVMQHLIMHGSPEQRRRVVQLLGRQASTIGQCSSGCAVLAAAMRHGAPEEATWLALSVVQEQGLIEALSIAKHGHAVAVLVLQALPCGDLAVARARLLDPELGLRASRYGCAVAQFLDSGEPSRSAAAGGA